jgi:glutamate/tyrosine decarboxylase-like PLP-dependent enzyme
LYAPLEAGCALVKSGDHLRNTFSYHPPYYQFGIEATNFVDLGPQNSRGFRALKVWLALQHVGRAGYETMLADDIRLASLLHETARAHPDLDVFTCCLSISTFRYIPAELRTKVGDPEVEDYLNRLNKEIQARMESQGETFLSNAVLDGMYVLRGCIVNFRTEERDVRAIPGIVVRTGEEVHRELYVSG